MIILGNDDRKKAAERDSLSPFLAEYAYATGDALVLVAASERPDFICEKRGQRYGLEVVQVMRSPPDRRWDVVVGRDDHMDGLDAAILLQEAVYRKDAKRASRGWQLPTMAILVIQLAVSSGEQVLEFLDDELMNEMAETGFREIWIADQSLIGPYGMVQVIGIKPSRWRGIHRNRLCGVKAYG